MNLANSEAIMAFLIDDGVLIATAPDMPWVRLPARLGKKLEREVGVDVQLLIDYRDAASRIGGDRWRIVDAVGWVADLVIVWVFLFDPRLSDDERAVAWQDVQEWSGIRIDEHEASRSGGWQAVTGDSIGTGDYGFDAHALRYYAAHGVAILVVGDDDAAVRTVLEAVRVDRTARVEPPRSAGPAPAALDGLLAPERGVKHLSVGPGPASREILRLAGSGRNLEVDVRFADGGELSVHLIGGKDPQWTVMFDADSPWTGSLKDMIADLRAALSGRVLGDVSMKICGPRATPAQEAAAGERFAAALRELGAR